MSSAEGEGATPAGELSDEQKEAILEEIARMRKVIRNQEKLLFGWKLQFTVRACDKSRADLCCVPPSGEKIFSVIGVKRKLGLVSTAPAEPRRAAPTDATPAAAAAAAAAAESGLVLPEGQRRARPRVNYAEFERAERAPALRDLVLEQVGGGERELVGIAEAVHASGERNGATPPLRHVGLALRSLLRSGRLRRRLARLPAAAAAGRTTEGALCAVLFGALQLEEAEGAPWQLAAEEEEGGGGGVSGGGASGGEASGGEASGGAEQKQAKLEPSEEPRGLEAPSTHSGGEGEEAQLMRVRLRLGGEEILRDAAAPHAVRSAKADAEKRVREMVDNDGSEMDESEADDDESEADDDESGGGGGGGGRKTAGRAVRGRRGRAADVSYKPAAESDSDYEYEDSDGEEKRRKRSVKAKKKVIGGSPPFVEWLLTVADLRHALPLRGCDTNLFHSPLGWTTRQVDGLTRRPKIKWVRVDESGEVVEECERRDELERLLELRGEHEQTPYLGQFVEGSWEISEKAVVPAISYALEKLKSLGVITQVPPSTSGASAISYCVRNKYFKGDPFPKAEDSGTSAKRAKRKLKEESESEEDELADFELQRRENIKRNQQILQELGLA
ncbi:hypothetical protein AB1Y20_018947 [Prymnesium parvum]|uniref:Non-specific serine/threonine protein kinase n=1 Tax=Prymnesium parvum TaxID=97485 RepID=A0AB34JT18_PRYPA